MSHTAGARRARLFLLTVFALLGLGVFSAAARADTPTPIPGTTTASTVYNADGSRTVTVQGQFEWTNLNTSDCGSTEAGFNVAWGDNNGNPLTENGTTILVGVLNATAYDPADNAVHGLGTCGAPNPALGHNSGSWGPISHTYLPGSTGGEVICPVLYHTHPGANDAAGGDHANRDNSFVEGGGACTVGTTKTVPALTTNASSGSSTALIFDTANLSGGSSPTGTITWTLFNNSTCSGSPAYTSPAVTVSGNGTYVSPTVAAAVGTYHWIATYSGDGGNTTVTTACADPAEAVTVSSSAATSTGTSGLPPGTVTQPGNVAAGQNPNLLPTHRGCVDRRKFTFRLHRFRKARITRVDVFVNHKRKLRKRGHDIRKVTIKRLPLGKFTIKIIARQSTGSTLTSTRRYSGCRKGKPRTRAHHHRHH